MIKYAGPGPYRPIEDRELRPIFYLTSMRSWVFAVIPVNTTPPPGTDDPRVTQILRRMLYLRRLHPPFLEELAKDARSLQTDRQMIAISAKLLSLMRQAFESPWAFPALLETKDILRFRDAFNGVTDITGVVSNVTGTTPASYGLSFLSRFAGTVVGHALYVNSLTNDYYESYAKKWMLNSICEK